MTYELIVFKKIEDLNTIGVLSPEYNPDYLECAEMPSHYSYATDNFNYKIMYEQLIGGVLTLKADVFEKVKCFR